MKGSSVLKKIIFSALHASVIFILLWAVNNTSYSTYADEEFFKKIFLLKDLILPNSFKPLEDFIFVNTSKDLSLIDDPGDWGNIAITDRKKLQKFFKILADSNNQHRFVLCDLFFETPSADDSLLSHQIARCRNTLFPYHMEDDSLRKPCIDVPDALADYQTYNGRFSKFRLIYKDSLRTIPLVMHTWLDSNGKKFNFFHLRSIAPRYYIRPAQLAEGNGNHYINLGELLQLDSANKEIYSLFLKNKIIVLGNFETDKHLTTIGNVDGPIILVDTYLSLKYGRAGLTWGWILFMTISLSVTSYALFFAKVRAPDVRVPRWLDFIISIFLSKAFSILGICTAIIFLSEILFSIQLVISPLFLYLVCMDWGISYYEHFKQKQK